jgi:hypothetical protein
MLRMRSVVESEGPETAGEIGSARKSERKSVTTKHFLSCFAVTTKDTFHIAEEKISGL